MSSGSGNNKETLPRGNTVWFDQASVHMRLIKKLDSKGIFSTE